MATPREQRLAKNEAVFRLANERMGEWEERHVDEPVELYFCECANAECREKVRLRESEYEHVRADPRHFVIVPGHEAPEVETTIERHDGWSLIEKKAEVREVVEALDPRGD
jgi:hypothetical protein